MTKWITLEALGRYLKVSRAYLYKLAQSGQIPAVKLGRTWRFDQERVDEWLRTKQKSPMTAFPWQDCLDNFLEGLRKKFGKRFVSLWIYGSWARGDAHPDSDVDLLIVLETIKNHEKDYEFVRDLAYQTTFGRDRIVVFSTSMVDRKGFLEDMEPLLMNIRREGKRAA